MNYRRVSSLIYKLIYKFYLQIYYSNYKFILHPNFQKNKWLNEVFTFLTQKNKQPDKN